MKPNTATIPSTFQPAQNRAEPVATRQLPRERSPGLKDGVLLSSAHKLGDAGELAQSQISVI